MFNRTLKPVFLCLLIITLFNACVNRQVLDDLLSTEEPPLAKGKDEIHVYLVKPKGDELEILPVKRKLKVSNQVEALTKSVSELLLGPNSNEQLKGYGTEIPKGTILLGVKENVNDIELNISKRFALGGGISSIETRLEQLRRTAAAAVPYKPVYLNVEGERLNILAGEGIEVHQPINR
jgi:spore germination protein GerM